MCICKLLIKEINEFITYRLLQALVWFIDQKKLGLMYDYSVVADDQGERYGEGLKGTFPGVEREFSLATLEGSLPGVDEGSSLAMLDWIFRFGGAHQDQAQHAFRVEPFAFQGFSIEDPCRHKGVIQPCNADPNQPVWTIGEVIT